MVLIPRRRNSLTRRSCRVLLARSTRPFACGVLAHRMSMLRACRARPNWVMPVFRETVLSIVRERYADCGPTLAAEKLSGLHGLDLGVETLRQWMIGAGIWVRRKDRLKRIHQPRARRDCLGELVQIDGSEHWWFEGRGRQCTLLVYSLPPRRRGSTTRPAG